MLPVTSIRELRRLRSLRLIAGSRSIRKRKKEFCFAVPIVMNSLLNAARTSASSSAPASRSFHTSLRARFPRRKVGIPAPPILAKTGVFLDEDPDINERIPYEEREGQGSSSAGHLLLQQQRHMLKYMRLIEHEMPKLVRKSCFILCVLSSYLLFTLNIHYYSNHRFQRRLYSSFQR